MSESERNKEELSEGLLMNYRASGASATSIATRASGAELIRQLSYHKLNHYYYQSDETLNQFAGITATKRKSGSGSTGTGASSAIVKRFSDNQYDYQYQKGQHRPTGATGAASRPRLLRQSTTTNSESVAGTSSSSSVAVGGHNAHNRRRQLAETREQRSWRSCDVNHHDVGVPALSGTHLLGGSGGVRARNNSVGRSDDITTSITPSFLDLSSSINSMNQQSAKPSPVGSNQGQLHVNNEEEDECDDDDAFVVVGRQQQQDQVRYTKGVGEGATDGQNGEEYRVVLPPLGIGTRSVTARKNNTTILNTQNLALSPQMVNAPALKTTPKNKKVIDKEDPLLSGANSKKKKKTVRRSSATSDPTKPKPASVKVAAVSAITAVAVVAVGVADKTSYPSSDESNNPRRRARGIVILTSVFLLFTCLFMVGITLRLAPLIDDLVRKENEMQTITSVSSNGDIIHINGTTGTSSSTGLLSQQTASQLGTILNSTTTVMPGIIIGSLTAAASNSSTMNLT